MADLDATTKDWIFELLEKNMKDYYFQVQYKNVSSQESFIKYPSPQAEWGWNSGNKKEELFEDSAWYLIAREGETGEPVAYSHFRWGVSGAGFRGYRE